MNACGRSAGITPLILNLSTSRLCCFTPRKEYLVNLQSKADCAPEWGWSFWSRETPLASTRVRNPDHPTHVFSPRHIQKHSYNVSLVTVIKLKVKKMFLPPLLIVYNLHIIISTKAAQIFALLGCYRASVATSLAYCCLYLTCPIYWLRLTVGN